MTKILLVDDSAFMRIVLIDIIKNLEAELATKFVIQEADSKNNALVQFEESKPDIIMLDIVMRESEVEGIEFLKAIYPYFDSKKVIVISSVGQESIILQCQELGIVYYLQKPFDESEIRRAT